MIKLSTARDVRLTGEERLKQAQNCTLRYYNAWFQNENITCEEERPKCLSFHGAYRSSLDLWLRQNSSEELWLSFSEIPKGKHAPKFKKKAALLTSLSLFLWKERRVIQEIKIIVIRFKEKIIFETCLDIHMAGMKS